MTGVKTRKRSYSKQSELVGWQRAPYQRGAHALCSHPEGHLGEGARELGKAKTESIQKI